MFVWMSSRIESDGNARWRRVPRRTVRRQLTRWSNVHANTALSQLRMLALCRQTPIPPKGRFRVRATGRARPDGGTRLVSRRSRGDPGNVRTQRQRHCNGREPHWVSATILIPPRSPPLKSKCCNAMSRRSSGTTLTSSQRFRGKTQHCPCRPTHFGFKVQRRFEPGCRGWVAGVAVPVWSQRRLAVGQHLANTAPARR